MSSTRASHVGRLAPIGRTLASLAIALGISAMIYQVSGYSAPGLLDATWEGSLGSRLSLETTIGQTVPLAIAAMGALVSFRAGFFNIGAQGQLYVGAIASVAVATGLSTLPAWLVIPAGMIAGTFAGAAWSLIAGVLRLYAGADEVLTTLMLTFIAALLLLYVETGPLKAPGSSGNAPVSKPIEPSFRISDVSGASVTTVTIAVVVLALTWLLVNRSGFGLQADLLGRNPTMARWAGVSATRIGLVVFAFAGGTAGLSGAILAFAGLGGLPGAFSPSLGFTALLVAVVGGLSVAGAGAAAILFGSLQAAVFYLPIATDAPPAAVDLFLGVVALLITARLPAIRRRRPVRNLSPPVIPEPADSPHVIAG